jgi:HAD superfamily hydrolase (TIGR01484 family)
MSRILLCADLDRTLIPNGAQEESPGARPLLRRVAARPELTLAYVSGRHRRLLMAAIQEYDLPVPDFAIGDVGTSIYEIGDGRWHPWHAWEEEIAPDWRGKRRDDVAALFHDEKALRPQEMEKQNTFKVSYYAPEDIDSGSLLARMQTRLDGAGIHASLIWSIDEPNHVGLLDILPARATKLHAIRFLMDRHGFDDRHTVFAGDSGNDLPVLTSGMQSVLVRNAADDVRRQAVAGLQESGREDTLYLARGGLQGMNGNYAAGVLEGLVHFLPETREWMV